MTITVELSADDIRRAVIAYATGLNVDRPCRLRGASLYQSQGGHDDPRWPAVNIGAVVELETLETIEQKGAECSESGDSGNGQPAGAGRTTGRIV